MSYFIAKTNNYFGLQPVSVGGVVTNFQENYYLVSSSESEIDAGDVVVQTSLDTVKSITAIAGAFIPTSSSAVVGVAAMTLLANTGSTAATLTANTSQMLLVYDAPYQVFGITDSSSGIIATQTGLYKNYPILATGVTGSTGAFQVGKVNARSNQALSGVASTLAGAVKVIGLHPVEGGVYSTLSSGTASSTDNRKWLVMFNSGISVASTAVTSIANTSS